MKNLITLAFLLGSANLFAQSSLVGPDGPVMTLSNNGAQIHFTLANPVTSNNYLLQYEEIIFIDSLLAPIHPDSTLNFQGYLIYQILDTTVTWDDKDDTNRVRLIYQCDIADLLDTLINEEMNAMNICGPVVKVNGHNTGIVDTFSIAINPFTHLPYQNGDHPCFWGVAYAYNEFMVNPACPGLSSPFFYGPRKTQECLEGFMAVENLEIPQLQIHPNPAAQYFEITGDFENAQIELMNLQGQVLMHKNILRGEKIPVAEFNNGVYVIQVKSGMHHSYRRVIIQHE
jgi:hypothetical protein